MWMRLRVTVLRCGMEQSALSRPFVGQYSSAPNSGDESGAGGARLEITPAVNGQQGATRRPTRLTLWRSVTQAGRGREACSHRTPGRRWTPAERATAGRLRQQHGPPSGSVQPAQQGLGLTGQLVGQRTSLQHVSRALRH